MLDQWTFVPRLRAAVLCCAGLVASVAAPPAAKPPKPAPVASRAPKPLPKPAIDPRGLAAIDRMSAFLKTVQRFKVSAETTRDEVVDYDMKVQKTSTGETYDMYAMTAAHPTLALPSYARVTNVATGSSVIVRVNDRGPFLHNRIIDLSYAAAHKLGIAPEKVVITVGMHGNTSAASIPLALNVAVKDGRIKKGDLVLLEAMGGGFTWGSALIRW